MQDLADYTQKPTPGTALSAMPLFHRPCAAAVTADPLVLCPRNLVRCNKRPEHMLEIFLTHAIPPMRARLLIRGAVSPRDRLSAPPAKESSTRARRPRRLVDLLTVLKGRLLLVDNVKLSPTLPYFYGWPPICSPASALNLFLLSRLCSLRTGSGGPGTDHTSSRHSRLYKRKLQCLPMDMLDNFSL